MEAINVRVCVLGLGQVGLPSAKYIANKSIEVTGYDKRLEAVENAEVEGIKAFTNWQEVPISDVYVICVHSGLKDGAPDFSSIFDVCEKIHETILSGHSPKSCLVSIESTVVPGLSRKVYNEIFQGHVKLVHVPHRFWAEDPSIHGVNQPRVFGAIDDESLKDGLNFYDKILGLPLHKVSSIDIAEMSKIAENTYRYVQIAFAEELRMVCDKLRIDFNQVRNACNTKWNIEILEARDGIGGHCLRKDTGYFLSLTETALLTKSATLLDDAYKKWIREKSNG
jgi:nucleotide sugar dehydrogenase